MISVDLVQALFANSEEEMNIYYQDAPRMVKQVEKMREELAENLPRWIDANARTVLEHLKR